jgi:hypothetical protein
MEGIMEAISQAPGLFLGLIGWAATSKIIIDSGQISPWQQRALVVFTWMLWMIPAFDATVYQGFMPADMAVTYCATMTGALIFVVSLTGLYKRSKQ